jgi:FKBP-type peptidyl-prolyl cis-trans isomerase (trigger factor)
MFMDGCSRALSQGAEQGKVKMVALRRTWETCCSRRDRHPVSMTVDVEPTFDLPKYKKIPCSSPEPAVTDAQVDEQIGRFAQGYREVRGDFRRQCG